MLKIISISLISLFLYVILKNKSQEFALIISIAGSVLIVIFAFDYLCEIINYFSDLSSNFFIDEDVFKIALKIIFVSYITEFVSDLSLDFGNSAIASKVIFGGKVAICVIAIPVIKNLFSLLFSFC